MALYLQHVLDTTKSCSSVDSAIYGIQWVHNLADVPSPTNSPDPLSMLLTELPRG